MAERRTIKNFLKYMASKDLKELYNKVVEEYCTEFCKKYGFDDYEQSMWVTGEIGGILSVSDYFINFNTIKFCVDNNVSWYEFVKWYNYCIDLGQIDTNLQTPNIDSWVHGCPRMSLDDIKRLKDAKNSVEEAKKRLEEEISKTVLK